MEMNQPIEIHRVTAEIVRPLRHQVLRPHQTLAECVWAGDSVPSSAHFAALYKNQVIGVASISIDPRPNDPPNSWRLRGMATEADQRRIGIGTRVLDACIAHARAEGGAMLWCNARTSAVEFYRKQGFETVGGEFEVQGVGPHYVMARTL